MDFEPLPNNVRAHRLYAVGWAGIPSTTFCEQTCEMVKAFCQWKNCAPNVGITYAQQSFPNLCAYSIPNQVEL